MNVSDAGVFGTYLMTGVLFLLTSIYYSYSGIKKRVASFMSLAMLFAAIGGFITFFQEPSNYGYLRGLPAPFNTDDAIQMVAMYGSSLVFLVTFFTLYLFFEQLFEAEPNILRLAIMSFLSGATIFCGWIATLTVAYNLNFIDPDLLWDFFYGLTEFSVFAFGSYVYWNAYKATRENRSWLITVILGLVAISCIICILDDIKMLTGVLELLLFVSVYRAYFVAIPLIVLVVIYMLDLDFIYRLPFNVYSIMFFARNTGLPVHQSMFKTLLGGTIDDVLTPGTIVALNSFIKETLGKKENLKIVETTDKAIVFSTSTNDVFMSACIAQKATFFLRHSLILSTNEFAVRFTSLMDDSVIDTSKFTDAEKIIEKYFPFLVFARPEKKTN